MSDLGDLIEAKRREISATIGEDPWKTARPRGFTVGRPPRLTGVKGYRLGRDDGVVLMVWLLGFRGYAGIRWPVWWRPGK